MFVSTKPGGDGLAVPESKTTTLADRERHARRRESDGESGPFLDANGGSESDDTRGDGGGNRVAVDRGLREQRQAE
jgi:hypothetical protein